VLQRQAQAEALRRGKELSTRVPIELNFALLSQIKYTMEKYFINNYIMTSKKMGSHSFTRGGELHRDPATSDIVM
jgi:hypothetical protein